MPEFCSETVESFLDSVIFYDHKFITFTAIEADTRKIITQQFGDCSDDEAVAWIEKYNNKGWNIYYSFNPVREGVIEKPTKLDVEKLIGFHVDIDMPSELVVDGSEELKDKWIDTRIQALGHKCVIVFSGNGIQAMWVTQYPCTNVSEVNIQYFEEINRRIAQKFGGDHCHNIDRILRFPGTVNWPNKKKQDLGYKPRQTEFINPRNYLLNEEVIDFRDSLPSLEEKKKSVSASTTRTNYLNKPYSKKYRAKTFDDLADKHEALKDTDYDTGNRSDDGFRFIIACVRAFMELCKCEAEELSQDVYRNISEIVINYDADFVTHYEHNGYEKLGYDIERAVDFTTAELPAYDEAKRARRIRETFANAANDLTKDDEDITLEERFAAILKAFETDFAKAQLPNCDFDTHGKPMRVQPVTQMNIAAVLKMAGIRVKWNDMKDHTVYSFEDEAVNKHITKLHAKQASDIDKQLVYADIVTSFIVQCGLRNESSIRHYVDSWAKQKRFHPWKEYCTAVEWDGNDYIGQIADCIDTEHELRNIYIEILFMCMAATTLSHEHFLRTGAGEQISSNVVLVGDQGIEKTRFFNSLVPPEFRSHGTTLRLGSAAEKDHIPACLSGVLCVLNEIGQTMRNSDYEALKDFISSDRDSYRLPYARTAIVKPRMTVFCGTANELDLQDSTGSRRFLAMQVNRIDHERLEQICIQQAHAQAYAMVTQKKMKWWLNKEEETIRHKYNQEWQLHSEEEVILTDYLNSAHSEQYSWLNISEIFTLLELRFHPKKCSNVKRILKRLGCEYKDSITVDGKRLKRVWHMPIKGAI